MTIAIITTGGTIGAEAYADPVHPPQSITLPREGVDYVRDALQVSFVSLRTRCISLPPKDSKDIDVGYRETLLETMVAAPEKDIAYTHGSDALMATKDYLFGQLVSKPSLLEGKKIVGIVAMTPLANGPRFDALPNLDFGLDLLAHRSGDLATLGFVAAGYRADGKWGPVYYPYYPDIYSKVYVKADGRRNHFAVRAGARAPKPIFSTGPRFAITL